MPVLPLVGSISTVLPGWIFPARSASLIMLTPMRSFTLLQRIEALQLGDHRGLRAIYHLIQSHQGRVADECGYVVGNLHIVLPDVPAAKPEGLRPI